MIIFNGTIDYALSHSHFPNPDSLADQAPVPLSQLESQVMITGAPSFIPPACRVNCSYTVSFDGPDLSCSTAFVRETYTATLQLFDVYSAVSVGSASEVFSATTWFPLVSNGENMLLQVEKHALTSVPWRAQYDVRRSWRNGVQATDVKTTKVATRQGLFAALGDPTNDGIPIDGFSQPNKTNPGTTPAYWPPAVMEWYRESNLRTIIVARVHNEHDRAATNLPAPQHHALPHDSIRPLARTRTHDHNNEPERPLLASGATS